MWKKCKWLKDRICQIETSQNNGNKQNKKEEK